MLQDGARALVVEVLHHLAAIRDTGSRSCAASAGSAVTTAVVVRRMLQFATCVAAQITQTPLHALDDSCCCVIWNATNSATLLMP